MQIMTELTTGLFLYARTLVSASLPPPLAVGSSLSSAHSAHKYAARRARLRGRGGRGPLFSPVQVCLPSMATNLSKARAPCEALNK